MIVDDMYVLGGLASLSTKYQLHLGGQFYWWNKSRQPEKYCYSK